MNRNRIIALGTVLRVVAMAASSLVGFCLMPFLVHRLGDRMFGYWALIGAVLGYYGILDLGITPAVQFQVAKAVGGGDRESPNRTISTALVAFTVLGLTTLAITVVLAAYCPLYVKQATEVGAVRTVLIILGLGCAIGFPSRVFLGAVNAHLRIDLNAAVTLLILVLRTLLTVAVVLQGWSIVGLAIVSVLTDVVSACANYWILRKIHMGLRISVGLADRATLKELLHYGGYSVVIQVGDQLRFAVDSWMVAVFVGVGAVAHYVIGSRLSSYFLIFIISTIGFLSPWFSQLLGGQDFSGIRKMLDVGTRCAASLSTIIACSFFLYGRAFISTWMGGSYTDAYWPSAILVLAIYCDVAQQPSVAYLLGVFRHRYLAIQTLSEGIANLILSMYWARQYGMVGVAMGTLVPMVVAKLFLQPAYVCRHAGISLREYYFSILGKSVLVPALLGVAMWWLVFRNIDLLSLWKVVVVVLLQATLCAGASFFLVFEREDRHRLLSKLRSGRKADAGPLPSPPITPELTAQQAE